MLQDFFLFLYFIAQFFGDNNFMSQCQNVELTYFQVKKKIPDSLYLLPDILQRLKEGGGGSKPKQWPVKPGKAAEVFVSTLLYEFLSLSPFFSEAGSHVAHAALKLAVDNLELLAFLPLHPRVLRLQARTTTPQLFFSFSVKKGVINWFQLGKF